MPTPNLEMHALAWKCPPDVNLTSSNAHHGAKNAHLALENAHLDHARACPYPLMHNYAHPNSRNAHPCLEMLA